MRIILIALATALFALGCDNKDTSATPPAPPKQAEAKPTGELPRPPVAIAPSEAKEEDDDLPTQEDFTEEAEKDISATNVESEVDKLAKEIGE